MTNLQLLLSIGIPTFFVLIGILLNHREVGTLRDDMNRRFTETNRDLNQRFDEARRETNQRFEQVNQRFEQVNQRFEQVNQRFEEIYRHLDRIDTRLNRIEDDQKQFFKTTGALDGRLEELSARVK